MKRIVILLGLIYYTAICPFENGHFVNSGMPELMGGGEKIGMAMKIRCPLHNQYAVGRIVGIEQEDGTKTWEWDKQA